VEICWGLWVETSVPDGGFSLERV